MDLTAEYSSTDPFFYQTQFDDVQPIPQLEAPNAVVKIAYDPEYRTKMDLFRALLQRSEYSRRALRLTKDLLELNPSNYTVW